MPIAPDIDVLSDGPVLRVNLNRPERRNAFNPSMIEALTEVFRRTAVRSNARVAVLAGHGKVFSAGADLAWMREAADYDFARNVADARRLGEMLAAIRDCPMPVVARVHGAAMGGGVGLVAAADIAVAESEAIFAFSEVRLGLVPAVISPYVLPRIGVSAARELFLTGERFDASRALSAGLVAQVVPRDDLDTAVAAVVASLLQGSRQAQAAIKKLVGMVHENPSIAAEYAARLIASARASDDGREGMGAFLERRRPNWAGPGRTDGGSDGGSDGRSEGGSDDGTDGGSDGGTDVEADRPANRRGEPDSGGVEA